MKDTKQRILDVSLDLFSQSGFSAVSIRDICRQVQIKESSVYYYFKNKQAIFDELLCLFEKKASEMMHQLDTALIDQTFSAKENFYETVCNIFFESYFMDSFCNKVMRLLLIEQLNSNTVQKIYDRWMFVEPLSFQSKVFSILIQAGAIQNAESEYLAVKYYAPIYFFAQRWLFSGTLSEERKKSFRTSAYCHIQNFFTEIGV